MRAYNQRPLTLAHPMPLPPGAVSLEGIAPAPRRRSLFQGQEALQSALEALTRLMGAQAIDLLHRSSEDGVVQTLLSSGERSASVDIAIPEDESNFLALRETRWSSRGGETMTLIKLVERRDSSVWAAITFAGEFTQIGDHIIEQMPIFVELLVSHASTLSALTEARTRAQALGAALDQNECGVFILKRDHTLLFANRAAHSLLEHARGLQLSRGKLRPPSYKDSVRFETAIDYVIDAAQHAPAEGHNTAMVLLLPACERGKRLIASIAPASRGTAGQHADKAAVVITVQPSDEYGNHGVEAVCQAYDLSPVEVQLVCHLVLGLSVSEAATKMRVKVDTARAYLKQVFAKTGTNRQASLLQLITRHQRVIRSDHFFVAG